MADLAALLDREATAEIEGIVSEARSRASEIVAGARDEAQSLVAARRRSAETQHQAALVRARSAAQLEASSLTLRAQHSAIESVFADAERNLAEVTGKPGYASVLGALVREALAQGGVSGDEVSSVVVNPSDVAVARDLVKELKLAATVESDPGIRGGVRLRVGSNVVIENTLFGRLAALKGELAAEVAQVLLSKEG